MLAASLLLQPACSNAEPKDDLIASLEQLSMQGNAEATYHLGMAYKALGQNALAMASLERAVAASGQAGFPQLDNAKSVLAELTKANAAPGNVN